MVGRVSRAAQREITVAVVFLAGAVWLVWQATGFGDQAKILPLAVGLPLVGLSALNLAFRVADAIGRVPAGALREESADAATIVGASGTRITSPSGQPTVAEKGIRLRWVLLIVLSLVLMFYLLGIMVTALLFPLGVMRTYGHAWLRSVLSAGATFVLLYGATKLLAIPVYEGWLFLQRILPELPL